MFLEEIDIIGFKSFANKTVLRFPAPDLHNKGITAIVGPNGSGKSNVADAIRWVLGESSAKTLRGKSRDDVIFSGSAKKNRMNYAEVTLRINNESQDGGIELKQIEITRRVFRDGEAEFLMNQNKVRREDIIMMLAQASFGQRAYAVIGQGMADSVLSASLQERKAFFEEAAGVTQYQLKRTQALHKFDSTRENLAQTELTIAELDPRLKSLTRQVKKLEQREALEKELSEVQLHYYKLLIDKLDEMMGEAEQNKKVGEKEVKRIEAEMKVKTDALNALYVGDSRQGVFEELQRNYSTLINEKNQLLRDEALIKAKQDSEYQKGGQSNLVWLKNKKDELLAEVSRMKAESRGLTIIWEQQTSAKKQKDAEIASLDSRILTVKQELELIKQSQLSAFDEEDDLSEIHKMQSALLDVLMNMKDLSNIEDVRAQARTISAKLSVYLETLQTKKKTHMSDLSSLQTQLEKLIDEKNQQSSGISEVVVALASAQEKKNNLEKNIEQKEAEIQKLDNEIILASSSHNESALIAQIEKQLAEITLKVANLDKGIVQAMEKIEKFNETEEEKKGELMKLQKEIQEKQNELNRHQAHVNTINIEVAKFQIRQEDLEKEILEEQLELAACKKHELTLGLSSEEAHQQIHSIKKQLEVIGSIDQETIKEYNEIKERYDFLVTQTQDLEQAIISLEKVIEELDVIIKEQFEASFKEINTEFQKYFKILFNGGKAELYKVSLEEEKKTEVGSQESGVSKNEGGVVSTIDKIAQRIKDREKESYSGIEIKAEPSGKRISSIAMLSGGERALTSIALICAIIANNNSPFVLLDEMDAALDESNAMRFASILKELSNKTQFIVITHTRATMNQAQLLYGVTMADDGVSKLLSIELQDAEKLDVVRH